MQKIILITATIILFTYAIYASYFKARHKYDFHRILLVAAMDTEAAPIIREFNLKQSLKQFDPLPMHSYEGEFHQYKIMLVVNGLDPATNVHNVGTQAGTLATYIGIQRFHPDLIISIGTAGGIGSKGATAGDIYFSKNIYFYDRRIPLPKYHEYGLGGYDSISFANLARVIGFKTGNVCSGDSFDENETDTTMFTQLQCSAIDMEAAGVAWVSMLMKTPMLAIKGITNDVAGKDAHANYKKNLPSVTNNLAEKLKLLLVNM